MSEREYVKQLVDIIPEEHLDKLIEYLLNLSGDEYDEKKFELISKHILDKYRKAFEELAH